MISAFGVEHSISKAFTKLKPKLVDSLLDDTKIGSHATMSEKMHGHAIQYRNRAGSVAKPGLAPHRIETARQQKAASRGIISTISRKNRKKRYLP